MERDDAKAYEILLTSAAFSEVVFLFFSSPRTANWFVLELNPQDCTHISP